MNQRNPWAIERLEPSVVERLAATHSPHPQAVEQGVDLISDPQRQDNDGYNWTRLRFARNVADVVPGSAVVLGSAIGRYLAKVIAWDFEVDDLDPIVTLELLPVTPEAMERALARSRPPAA